MVASSGSRLSATDSWARNWSCSISFIWVAMLGAAHHRLHGAEHLIEMIEGTEDVRVASNALLRGLNRFLNMSRVHRKRAFVHPAGE